jgi:tRNA-dihydrouridine synthase B
VTPPPLTSPFKIGDVAVSNRLVLAPLAGIGNWFVRLQARRHGAGLAVSEMVSSVALARGNRRTLAEMLRIDPREHPVSVQLFGADPGPMAEAAAIVADAGADLIDLNFGCPVPKVCKTGAGAALLREPDRALALVYAAAAPGLPVTVKLRSGLVRGDRSGLELAVRLAEEGGVAALGFHPRAAADRHAGGPDYDLAAELVERVEVPVVLSGGLGTAAATRAAFARSGADAVMLARGALGNPWLFEELAGTRAERPRREEIVGELAWTVDRAEEHWGAERAARNLRKLYPHYLERLGVRGREADAFQRARSLDRVREMLAGLDRGPGTSAGIAIIARLPETASATERRRESGVLSI